MNAHETGHGDVESRYTKSPRERLVSAMKVVAIGIAFPVLALFSLATLAGGHQENPIKALLKEEGEGGGAHH